MTVKGVDRYRHIYTSRAVLVPPSPRRSDYGEDPCDEQHLFQHCDVNVKRAQGEKERHDGQSAQGADGPSAWNTHRSPAYERRPGRSS